MKRSLIFAIVLAFGGSVMQPQVPPKGSGMSPKEIVNELCRMATAGDLLTPEGWNRASRLFTHPSQRASNKLVLVISNYWGPPGEELIKGNSSRVIVGFKDAGWIDSSLRYTPPNDAGAVKSGMLFNLVLTPTHGTMFGPDGKTIIGEIPGADEWEIDSPQGPPWTTVNTAIRYVLEARGKTIDPIIKKNADQTIAALLRLH